MNIRVSLLFLFVFLSYSSAFGIEIQQDIDLEGTFKTVLKHQSSYKTPFDHPSYGYDQKSGANHREDQWIRSKAEATISLNKLGDEWFGIFHASLDTNMPDTDAGESAEGKMEVSDIAIMWRPFYFQGGRPFGVTAGIQTLPPTLNGFNTYLFEGDIDLDFPANLATGLISVPAITFDFHINPDTGIGMTGAKGCSYISESGTFLNPDSSTTFAFWVRGKINHIRIAGAYQRVVGNRGSTKPIQTDSGNTYSIYSDKGYGHFVGNGTISYTTDISDMKIMPYYGYQILKGDETPLPDYQNEENTAEAFSYAPYGPRKIKGEIHTIGLKINKEIFKKKSVMCLEYSDVVMGGFNGLDGLKKGAVDRYVDSAFKMINFDGFWSESSISGWGTAINKFADIDYMLNLEYVIELRKHIKAGVFFYSLKSVDDKTINNSEYISKQIRDRLKNKLIVENRLDDFSAGVMAEMMFQALRTIPQNVGGITLTPFQDVLNDTKAGEWTDTKSIGMFVSYCF